jgi:hypothetical protein
MPWLEFEPDTVNLAQKAGAAEKRAAWAEYRKNMLGEMNLEVKAFTARRGDVFVWHSGLLHGGAPVRNERSTRKSFVVHYSTAATYKSRRATMKMKYLNAGEAAWRGVSGSTDKVLVKDGNTGIDNPLRQLPEAS